MTINYNIANTNNNNNYKTINTNSFNDVKHKLHNINGYNILLLQTNNGNVSVKSFCNTGYIQETEDNCGINHLLEHVCTYNKKVCKNDNCMTYMQKNGILMNASTGQHLITYFVNSIRDNLDEMIEYICNCVINNDNITEENVEKEKKAVLNEILMALNNSGDINKCNFHLIKSTYKYEYRNIANFFDYPTQILNLKKLNAKQLKDYWNKYYNSIIFVVSGNFHENHVLNIFRNILKDKKQNFTNHDIKECFNLDKKSLYIPSKNIQNTVIFIGLPSYYKNTIRNIILLDLSTKYLRNICMDILRSKEELIYGIDIKYSMNYCGVLIYINVNVSNDNAKITLYKLIDIIKNSKRSIDNNFLDGIKKIHQYSNNNMNNDNICNFYENMYLNKLYNRCDDKVPTIDDYNKNVLSVKGEEISKCIAETCKLESMKLTYTSQKSMI